MKEEKPTDREILIRIKKLVDKYIDATDDRDAGIIFFEIDNLIQKANIKRKEEILDELKGVTP